MKQSFEKNSGDNVTPARSKELLEKLIASIDNPKQEDVSNPGYQVEWERKQDEEEERRAALHDNKFGPDRATGAS